MQTQEIPTHEWVPFLNDFSRRHQGQPVTVEVCGEGVGEQTEARHMPLIGVNVDLSGDTEQIEILMGGSTQGDLMHAIARPLQVMVAQGEGGADQELRIDSRDGSRTLMRLE